MYPRKPAPPSFWRFGQWSECLPPPSNSSQQDGLPHLPEFSEPKAIIAAMDPYEVNATPVPLARAKHAAAVLDAWFEQASTTLTWPPTVKGFVEAAKPLFAPTATADEKFVLGLLDAFRPDLIAAARLEVDLRLTWMAEAAKPRPTTIQPHHDGGKMSPMASEICSWLASLRSRPDAPLSVLQEELDGKIKHSIMTTKGAGIRSRNYWFEDMLWPALCELAVEDLTDLKKYWPTHQEFSFNDPVKAMESRAFWQGQRYMQAPARRFLFEELLPAIVDGKSWDPAQRLGMLEPLLSRVKEHPGLVRDRLELWKSWGGDLDMPVNLPAEEGALSAPRTTAREWLAQNNIDPNAQPAPRPRRRTP